MCHMGLYLRHSYALHIIDNSKILSNDGEKVDLGFELSGWIRVYRWEEIQLKPICEK